MLLNNAGIGGIKGTSWNELDNWKKIFDVNIYGYALVLSYTLFFNFCTWLNISLEERNRGILRLRFNVIQQRRRDIEH